MLETNLGVGIALYHKKQGLLMPGAMWCLVCEANQYLWILPALSNSDMATPNGIHVLQTNQNCENKIKINEKTREW